MKSQLKTAVIGCGNMGKNHIRIYSEISNLVAISDIEEKRGLALAKKYKVRFYKNYQEMLDIEKPDAVSVVVPTKLHKDVAIKCLERKIPTLLEKPIATTVKDANDIINAAKKVNTFLMIGHIERFNPAVKQLKKLILQKKLGKIISLLAVRVGINLPSTKHSNVILDLAIHDIDIFNYLLDELPVKVNFVKNKIFRNSVVDSAAIMLKYNNANALIQTNWITPIKMRKLYLTGTSGFVELDYISQRLTVYKKKLSIKNYGEFSDFVSLSKSPKKEVYVSKEEPLKKELEFFLKNIKSKNLESVSWAIKALEIVT